MNRGMSLVVGNGRFAVLLKLDDAPGFLIFDQNPDAQLIDTSRHAFVPIVWFQRLFSLAISQAHRTLSDRCQSVRGHNSALSKVEPKSVSEDPIKLQAAL